MREGGAEAGDEREMVMGDEVLGRSSEGGM